MYNLLYGLIFLLPVLVLLVAIYRRRRIEQQKLEKWWVTSLGQSVYGPSKTALRRKRSKDPTLKVGTR